MEALSSSEDNIKCSMGLFSIPCSCILFRKEVKGIRLSLPFKDMKS